MTKFHDEILFIIIVILFFEEKFCLDGLNQKFEAEKEDFDQLKV